MSADADRDLLHGDGRSRRRRGARPVQASASPRSRATRPPMSASSRSASARPSGRSLRRVRRLGHRRLVARGLGARWRPRPLGSSRTGHDPRHDLGDARPPAAGSAPAASRSPSHGDHSADVLAINIAVGAIAIGATVAIATNERSVLATMSATAAMSSRWRRARGGRQPRLGHGVHPRRRWRRHQHHRDGADRQHLRGDARHLDGIITSSTSIEVRATGENVVDATRWWSSLSVFGVSGAVAAST